MAENKTCKQCGEQFEITDDDIEFIKKVSPEINGKRFYLPNPELCLLCRQIEHLAWRNERVIYKRKSDKTGKEIISIYAPDKNYIAYGQTEWYQGDWNPLDYGKDFNFSQSFFEQFDELMKRVPRLGTNLTDAENSEFCNSCWHIKDCYLTFNVGYSEKCMYCTQAFFSKDCLDCFDIRNCEYCYGCFDCGTCNNCKYLDHCKDCSECHFIYDCSGCRNCYMSSGLHNKQYYFENKQLTKEEYEQKMGELNLGKYSVIEEQKNKFAQMKKNTIHKPNHNIKTEGCTGDYLIECNNCKSCFNAFRSENCYFVNDIDNDGKDSRYIDYAAENELCYDGVSLSGYRNILGCWVVKGRDLIYCNVCMNCSNCFGCTGLQNQKYCILNKQYTKEEYEKLVPRIIEHMKQTREWGRFYPIGISPFGYNESCAQIYFPKEKDEAVKIGAKWQDEDYSLKYEGPFYEPKDDIREYIDNEQERKNLLSGILKCEITGKPFKIMPQELAFYMEHNLPITRKYSEERFNDLFKLRNPRKLYHRQCMCEETFHGHDGHCKVEFETTYAPERPEKVYCESCYQKAVI